MEDDQAFASVGFPGEVRGEEGCEHAQGPGSDESGPNAGDSTHSVKGLESRFHNHFSNTYQVDTG